MKTWTVTVYKRNPANNTSTTYRTRAEAVAAMGARELGVSLDRTSGEVVTLECDGQEIARRRLNHRRISWQ